MISLTPKARPLIAPAPVATANPRQLEGALNGQPPAPIGAPTAAPSQPLSVGASGASDYQKLLAAQLMREGGSTAPVRTGYEGLGRMGQALSGAFLARDAQAKDQAQAKSLAEMLQGGIGGANIDPAMAGIIQAVAGQDPMAAAQMAGSVINQRAAGQAAAARDDLDFQRQIYLKAMEGPKDEFERLIAGMSPEQQAAARQARLDKLTTNSPVATVTVENKLDMKRGEASIAVDQKEMEGALEAARSAGSMVPQLEQMYSLVKSTPTGFGQASILPIKQLGAALGLDVEGLPQQELLRGLTKELLPRMRAPGSGATSDMEMRTFEQALGGLGNTQEANMVRWAGMLQVAKRSAAEYNMMRSYYDENGSLRGFQSFVKEKLGPTWPTVQRDADFDALESGTVFKDTEGKFWVKP